MNARYLQFLIALVLFLAAGCKSATSSRSPKWLEVVIAVPLGADKDVFLKRLGAPTQIESEGGGQAYIYSFPYKGQQIPKVTMWADKDGKVTAKNIHLFQHDGDVLTQGEIEALFKDIQFKFRDAPRPKDGHNISAFKYMYDAQSGIEVEINTAQANRASYIHWATLEKSVVTSGDP